jgi:hypothetical protein
MQTTPSPYAQYILNDWRLREELRALSIRKQAAIVRALADELEHLAPQGATGSLREQLVEELARLGCRILETAAKLSGTTEVQFGSDVLPANISGID